MNNAVQKTEKRERRHKRIRSTLFGTAQKPRLAVFRSNRALSAQLIDDEAGKTLGGVRTDTKGKKPLTEKAQEAGKKMAELAKSKGVTDVVFDRGGFLYTGNVKAFADGAREGGLVF